MVINVIITLNDIIIDLGRFKIVTSRDGIENIQNIYWYNGCIMFDVGLDLESICIGHLIFGEYPFYSPPEHEILGIERDKLTVECVDGIISKVERLEWVVDETYNTDNK